MEISYFSHHARLKIQKPIFEKSAESNKEAQSNNFEQIC